MMKEQRESKITALMALVVFAVFAVCVLLVLLTGADLYQRLSQRDQHNYDQRTAVQYITTRVRQADRAGGVSVESFGGVSALALHETIDGEDYVTYVYCHEGYLCELFSASGSGLGPEAGEKLLPAADLTFAWRDGLLAVCITAMDGSEQRLELYLRSGEGAHHEK